METDNGIGEVGVQTHARSKRDGHVGEQTHTEGSQGGDGGSRSDKITLDDLYTEKVLFVGGTQVSHAVSRADAGTASIRKNGSWRR